MNINLNCINKETVIKITMVTKLLILLQRVEHNQKYWKKNNNLVTKIYFSKRMTKRPKYFTPNEVSIHNTGRDIWVSFLGKVYNLTPLIQENAGNWISNYYSTCFTKSELKKEKFLKKINYNSLNLWKENSQA